ncbi:MAG: CPBP family intramembrane metalloprotease [Acidobacteria bacterium]|nr:CPBP family intramembrane metalloprotease [Acidobacteriota bacterium]
MARESGECLESLSAEPSTPTRWKRLQAVMEVVLCTDLLATLVVQAIFGSFGYKIDLVLRSSRLLAVFLLCNSALVLAIIIAIVKFRRETLATVVGLQFRWAREAIVGLSIVPILFLATASVGLFFRRFFPALVTAQNPLLSIIKTPGDMFWFLLMGVAAGGIKEEIQRAFVLRRFEKYLGGVYAGLLVWTLYFGIGHSLQGFDNAVGAAMLGLLFGLTYIWRQNVVAPIAAHAVYDAVVVLYSFFALQ